MMYEPDTNPIELALVGDSVYVWKADDWLVLRQKHRIIGNLVGTLSSLSRQDKLLGLPLELMPEEVSLLLRMGIAKLCEYSCVSQLPTVDIKEQFEMVRNASYEEQVEYFKEERRTQIISMVDKIVEGKRRKLMGLSKKNNKDKESNASKTSEVALPNKEEILREELNKITPIAPEMSLIQIPTECPWKSLENPNEKLYKFPENELEELRCRVYTDLWCDSKYITSGTKFGGHFLVYPGDPIKYHAQNIVLCQTSKESIKASDLVSLCRLGTSVKKSIIIATITGGYGQINGELKYTTLKWFPS